MWTARRSPKARSPSASWRFRISSSAPAWWRSRPASASRRRPPMADGAGEAAGQEVGQGTTNQEARETWITGIGILSCCGEGLDAHWQAIEAGKINIDRTGYAPNVIHPLAPMSFDAQFPRYGDH